jgi:microsomal dipeptidase-like Zn-dependent dipeptidase
MPNLNFYIDLHCHPNYKPFARAHKEDGQPPVAQTISPSNKTSLWYYNPPSLTDKLANYFLGITKFRQNNLTAALYGRLFVIVAGLGCVEKYFFNNKLGTSPITDLIDDFVAEFDTPRINAIEGMTDYWTDFQREINFMEQGQQSADPDANVVKIDNHWYSYRLAKNFADLQQNITENEVNEEENIIPGNSKANPIIITIIPAAEGLHILNCGLDNPCNPAEVKQNALALKQMNHAPWFVTFSHHFNNELCGHARSLRKLIGKLTDQEDGINSGFTQLGKEVLDILLDKNNGRRILIDVKHMSAKGRQEFYEIRRNQYNSEFPIIISHGVCNGLPTYGEMISNYPLLGDSFINPVEDAIGGDGELKNHNYINFYDDEIIEMVNSQGILGIQLDERRLANDDTIKDVKHSFARHKIMHYRSELVWKQIQYIAELLDDHDLYAWGNIAIGSDYDGLVDPLNAFWTAEQYDDLASYLERHAYRYLEERPNRLRNSFNKVKADFVIQSMFRDNAWNFLRKWF